MAKRDELAESAPRGCNIDQLVRRALAAYAADGQLRHAAGITLFRALSHAAQLDVDFTGVTGEAWLVAFTNQWLPEGILDCALMVGYRGRVKLAYREPRVVAIDAAVVRQADSFNFDKGEGRLQHKWELGKARGDILGAWARVDLRLSEHETVSKIEVLDITELNRIRASSRCPNSPAWTQWTDEMHKRAPLNRIFKYLPKSDLLAVVEEADRLLDPTPSIDTAPAKSTGRHRGAANLTASLSQSSPK